MLVKIMTPNEFGQLKTNDIWISLLIILSGLIGEYIFKYLVFLFGSLSGFETVADERIHIGNHLKRLPMGAFSDKNIGDISGVVTSDLAMIENYSAKILDQVLNGFLSILVAFLFMLIINWRLACAVALITVIALIFLNRNQDIGKRVSIRKQEAQGELIKAALEYVQGMSVVKSYNLAGEKAKRMDEAINLARDNSLDLEKKILPSISHFDYVLDIGIGVLIFLACYLVLGTSLTLPILFMLIIYVFKMFLPARALIVAATVTRILDASLDRYQAVKDLKPIVDKKQTVKINAYNIEFDKVSFAYENEVVIKNLSFYIPEKSMTALVGQSGCGKTTITSLIARFWDVQKGSVKVGNVDVKEMSVDQLMSSISMVFQKVYLFNDTVINNIRIGKPDATEKEVVEAAKKARCHDFILSMDNGYNTKIGEGGNTLSGGEKQRISIARAILKNAPIILLDEATASIDPENEKYIQDAIMELVKDKTLVVIAHRLSTIKSADQIIVLDEGQLVEQGTHEELLNNEGVYNSFWMRRTKASGWKIEA
ncbi:ABC transporter ATP-binding protein [Clostridiaceae bacterium M8S5]|nr:ABC transporter ATP-binding protein [Clostridiaceae bacterium M8S5]